MSSRIAQISGHDVPPIGSGIHIPALQTWELRTGENHSLGESTGAAFNNWKNEELFYEWEGVSR